LKNLANSFKKLSNLTNLRHHCRGGFFQLLKGLKMHTVVNNKVVRITYKYKRVIEKPQFNKSIPYVLQLNKRMTGTLKMIEGDQK